jgi:hypothetical protein
MHHIPFCHCEGGEDDRGNPVIQEFPVAAAGAFEVCFFVRFFCLRLLEG